MSLLARIAPYVLVLAVVGLAYWWAYSRGEAHTKAVYELRLQELRTSSATAQAKFEQRARDAERDASIAVADLSEKHVQEARDAQVEIDSLRADLHASRVRLSVPAASCAAGSTAGADAAIAGRSGAEARTQLMPATADALVGIVADGDAAVRQLNRCIDAYNAVSVRYNEGR